MKRLIDVIKNPSGLDPSANYIGGLPPNDLYVILTRSRDSDCLTESNWDVALEQLGGESDTVHIHRFGHWACGWWEAMSVRLDSNAYTKALEIEAALADYPVLDDDHHSRREQEAADEVWMSCYTTKERAEYIRANREQFGFDSYGSLLACVRGNYFCGYANELLG